MVKTIAAALNIRSNEERPLFWLLIHSFFVGFVIIFFNSAASALYLTKFSVNTIPYAYIGVALIVTVLGLIFSKCEQRFSFSKLLLGTLIFLFLSVCIFRLLLSLSTAKWPIMFLFIWIEVISVLLNLEFWVLTSRIFNVVQGKRLFGLIGSGEVAADIIGGFITPTLVAITGTKNLLCFASFGIIVCIAILFYILRSFTPQISSGRGDREERSYSLKGMLKNRFLVLIIIFSIISVFGYYFIDYAFYDRVESRNVHENELASFFGLFFAVVGIANLIFKIFLSGRLLSRFGLNIGLFGLPSILLLGSIAMMVSGSFLPSITLFFWIAIITKLTDSVVRVSIEEPSVLTLYQPFPASQRLGAQAIVDSIVEPIAGGLAGAILLLLVFLFNLKALHTPYFMFLIITAWIIMALLVRREYPKALGGALSKRILYGESISLEDRSSIDVLKNGLKSPHVGEVIYSLNMLERIEHHSFDSFLIDLLHHPAPQVRVDVLHRIERLHITSALEAVSQRLSLETLPVTLEAVICTYASLGGAEVIDQIIPYMEDTDQQIRQGAMVGLLRSGGIQGVLLAGADLLKRVASKNPEDREFAAQVLGEIGIRDFYQPLMGLLTDENLNVRKEALIAAGKLKNPRLWPLVVENLSVPEIYSTAVTTLVSGGDSTLSALEQTFSAEQDRELQSRIIRIFGQIRGNQVVKSLLEKITIKDKKISYQILLVLSLCKYNVNNEDDPLIQKKLHEEIGDAVWILAALEDIKQVEYGSLLKTALFNALGQSRKRIFFLLSFIYDSNAILQASKNLANQSSEKRGYALEIIDNMISQELKSFIMPLIEDPPDEKNLNNVMRIFDQEKMTLDLRLQDIVKHAEEWRDSWLESCALYTMVELSKKGNGDSVVSAENIYEFAELLKKQKSKKGNIDSVISALSHPDPLVRETAAWSLAQLDLNKFKNFVDKLKEDPDPRVSDVSYHIETGTMDKLMLTIDKVTFLKNTNIFAGTPESILVSVAEQLKEIRARTDEVIIRQGEEGDCMYIITAGRVHVYNDVQSIAHLGPEDVFGEFSIIDSEPRSASVAAEVETDLLRLDQSTFRTLMIERNEVAKGVIEVLCQRLRKTLEKAHEVGQVSVYKKVYEEELLQLIEEEKESFKEVLLPLEKVFILKTVNFFSNIPDKTLIEIASIMEEIRFQAGEKIIEKGEMGWCMYIVIAGQVRVHDGENTIAYLGSRAYFGELSVLDAEPRSASITAEKETRLLRLDQEPLYELMADRFELTSGIIHALTRRIRSLLEE